MHPLIDIALSRPGLFLEHAGAYAELATVELEEAIVCHQRKMFVAVGMWFSLGLTVTLLGISFMFQAALGPLIPDDRACWLWLPAALPLLVSATCYVWLKQRLKDAPFASLLEQFKADAKWLTQKVDAA
jgi:uncharacterized membrane protein YqjE